MRKLIYLSIIAGLLIAGCEPNEELYKELDKEIEPYHENIEITLTPDNYSTISQLALQVAETKEDTVRAELIEDYEHFSSERPVGDYVPLFLEDQYRALNKGSVANVEYNFYVGEPALITELLSAEKYTFKTDDYDFMGEEEGDPGYDDYFSEQIPADDYQGEFSNILTDNYPDAENGEIKAVEYNFFTGYEEIDKKDYFIYENGEWDFVPDVYALTIADRKEIDGLDNRYNFSEDAPPDKLLPIFLEENYPYSFDGDEMVLVYPYHTGTTVEERASKYIVEDGEWQPHDTTELRTGQFIHDGDKWVFDPTVTFTMQSDDYQLIVDERESQYIDGYGTGEYYSGANSYYVNFDIRPSARLDYDDTFEDLSDEEAEEIMWERILFQADEPMETRGALHVMLQKKFPEAKPTSSGVEVLYEVTFEMYTKDYARPNYTAVYKCVEAGNPGEDKLPEFEFVETDAPYNGE